MKKKILALLAIFALVFSMTACEDNSKDNAETEAGGDEVIEVVETDRGTKVITIGGVEHKLILTTKATKDITKRYGGLEKLGDKLLKNATMEESLGEVIWLIALLANQEILIHNLQHRDEPKPLLTEDEIELLTNPYELAEYKDAIMAAMLKGTKRHVESMPEKNEKGNAQTGQSHQK